MLLIKVFAVLVGAAGAAAQFTNPTSSSRLDIGQAIQIRWNTNGLQAPLSISLVPGGTVIRQDVVLQQIAVNIGNVGVLAWSADQTITAFPAFAMVIVDARGRVVVSDPFSIQSLTRQPALITESGRVRPTVTGPIKVHVSGTNTLDKIVDAPRKTDTGRKNNGNKNNDGGRKNNQQENGDKSRNGDDKDQGKQKQNNKGNDDNKNQDKAQDNKDNKDKGDENDGQKKLLPLPGLPKDGEEAPVSLLPLPNVSAAPTQNEEKTSSTTSSAAETSQATSSAVETLTSSSTKAEATEVAEAVKSTTADPAPVEAPARIALPNPEDKTTSMNEMTTSSTEAVTPVGGIIIPPTSAPAPAPSPEVEEEAKSAAAIPQPESLLPLPKPNVFNAEQLVASPTSATIPGGSLREEPAAMSESPASLMPLPGVATEMTSLMSLPTARSSSTSASSTESPLPAGASSDQPTAAASGRLFPSLALGLGSLLFGVLLV